MNDQQTMPMADSVPSDLNEESLDKEISRLNLCGLANNTKWNKLLTYMRNKDGWIPSYRTKWINGHVSSWDSEWFYHLPFPFKGVLWFDIGCHQNINKGNLLEKETINHSEEIISLLDSIGFVYEKKNDLVRIFGYTPKDFEDFD